jgi:REP element-mobilizing transposase RayT
MPVQRKILQLSGTYFITFTCHEWLRLIEHTNSYDLVYKWFGNLKSWGHYINGYVIMPNHLHALISFRNTGKIINTVVGNGKRLLAYGIIERLEQQERNGLLGYLNGCVNFSDRQRNKIHEVWEHSFDWKNCRSKGFLLQKLNYIHNNPCQERWQLTKSPAEYIHSSAKFYQTGKQGIYPVTHYDELRKIDLNSTNGESRLPSY